MEYVPKEFSSQEKFWFDMTSSLQVSTLSTNGVRIPHLSLNKIGEKPRATIILGNFVNNL